MRGASGSAQRAHHKHTRAAGRGISGRSRGSLASRVLGFAGATDQILVDPAQAERPRSRTITLQRRPLVALYRQMVSGACALKRYERGRRRNHPVSLETTKKDQHQRKPNITGSRGTMDWRKKRPSLSHLQVIAELAAPFAHAYHQDPRRHGVESASVSDLDLLTRGGRTHRLG